MIHGNLSLRVRVSRKGEAGILPIAKVLQFLGVCFRAAASWAVHTETVDIKQNNKKSISFSGYTSVDLQLSSFFCFESLIFME